MTLLQIASFRPRKSRLAPVVHLFAMALATTVLLFAFTARAQDASQQGVPDMGQYPPIPGHASRHGAPDPTPTDDENPYRDAIRLAQLKAARQKALVDDTDKLLKLAAELNDEVGNSAVSPISKVQLRKVALIQKLARSVEQNMKFSVSSKPNGPDQFSPPQFPNPQQHNPR